jgi:hypothetical protein
MVKYQHVYNSIFKEEKAQEEVKSAPQNDDN